MGLFTSNYTVLPCDGNGRLDQWCKYAVRHLPIVIGLMFVGTAFPRFTQSASAIPAFSRKYNLPCEQCHTAAPRLTNYGYAFYRAGFRLPGANKRITIPNSFDLFAVPTVQYVSPGHLTTGSLDMLQAQMAATVTGKLTVKVVFDYALDNQASTGFVDELWVQYNSAARGTFWSVRVGQIPVLDGFQLASDRQISNTDAQLFGPNGPNSGPFGIASLERGVEGGYTSGPLSARISLLQGVDENGDGNVQVQHAGYHDIALQSEYLLGKNGSAIQGFYYSGKQPMPAGGFTDSFERAALFGTYGSTLVQGPTKIPRVRAELNGGFLWGEDSTGMPGRQQSFGALLEADLYLRSRTGIFLRYDGVQPTNVAGTPFTDAFTTGVSHRFNRFLIGTLEYRAQRAPFGNSLSASMYFAL